MKQLHDIVRPTGLSIHVGPNQIVLVVEFLIHVLMEVPPEEVAELPELVAVKKASDQVLVEPRDARLGVGLRWLRQLDVLPGDEPLLPSATRGLLLTPLVSTCPEPGLDLD